MKINSYKNVQSSIVVNLRGFVFGLKEKYPLIGGPLVDLWRIACLFKFFIWRKALQVKVRLKYGNDKLDFKLKGVMNYLILFLL